ncbi:uridine phosphorylase [Mariniphaga anaerophila]|uniref:Uridine phosphorylase n=1 Tax=Mariniphaga anaerophila TaxID=1484053 RepID=A0A1M4TAP9_9BACT|nr:nucleoside phosphorylase [Mariniphaga anaerophila]SHE41609.1 uridine phosphorylase [Mariniphaga anaerophila]
MIQESELILNNDGTIFHLHLKPENVADQVILVGDQDRVETVAGFFDSIEFSAQNREFKTITGLYKNRRISVISTGIGTDNIDIVLNELDALVNIDLKTREIKKEKKSLSIVRIGTSGSLQEDIPVNSYVISQKSIGFDGMLNFYADRELISDLPFEKAFKSFTGWKNSLPTPYVVNSSKKLISKFDTELFKKGVTISAPGFYGPQGRVLRIPLAMPQLNQLLEQFQFEGLKITNFEMESSAIYGLSKMLGHNALTVCLIIANRVTGQANENYRPKMEHLIKTVLDNLTE